MLIICALLFIMEFTIAILRATLYSTPIASAVSGVVYASTTLMLTVYLVIVAFFLVRVLLRGNRSDIASETSAILRNIVLSVSFASAANMLFVAAMIVTAFHVFLDNPFVFRTTLLLQSLAHALVGLISVMSIRAPFGGRKSDRDMSPKNQQKRKEPDEGLGQNSLSLSLEDPSVNSEHVRFHVSPSSQASSAGSIDTVVVHSDNGET